MKQVITVLVMMMTVLPLAATAPHGRSGGAFLAYDVDFGFRFDNREFDRSDDSFTRSMTIAAARLTPSVGAGVRQRGGTVHRVMFGVDLMRNFGEDVVSGCPEAPAYETDRSIVNLGTVREFLLYYDVRTRFAHSDFEALAGVFPRSAMQGEYSEAFLSDSLRFMDPNIDGLLLKWRMDNFSAELGLDWMGKEGYARKERFQVFTAGEWRPLGWLALGWNGSFYHYAGSVLAPGVVDNHLFEPYLKLDFSTLTGMQALAFKGGALLTYQRDRINEKHHISPFGVEAVADIRNWDFGLCNTLYAGDPQMPYYSSTDSGGYKFASMLYRGSPFYNQGLYDLVDLYYAPALTEFVSLKISARFHFGEAGYLGCQQIASLVFDLEALRSKHKS